MNLDHANKCASDQPKTPDSKDNMDSNYKACEIAKAEKVSFYQSCYPSNVMDEYVNIEGPEFTQDYSYFMVDMSDDIRDLERGIPLLQENS